MYTAQYLLIPDYDIGFSVLVAGENGNPTSAMALQEIVSETVLPPLYAIARQQAMARFSGTYTAVAAGVTINSSLTLRGDSEIGLMVNSWISNGTNMIAVIDTIGFGGGPVRLFPAGLSPSRKDDAEGMRLAFRALSLPSGEGFCSSVSSVDSLRYGRQPLDEFVFELSPDGVATAALHPGLRVRMRKV